MNNEPNPEANPPSRHSSPIVPLGSTALEFIAPPTANIDADTTIFVLPEQPEDEDHDEYGDIDAPVSYARSRGDYQLLKRHLRQYSKSHRSKKKRR